MYKYRLTRRGKVVMTILIIVLFSVTCTLSTGIIASAQDSPPYKRSLKSTDYKAVSFTGTGLDEINFHDINANGNIEAENTNTENSHRLDASSKEPSGYSYMDICERNALNDTGSSYVSEDRKIAFLTFDDGPSKDITPQILDILNKYKIKATFFVLGSLSARNSTVLNDIAKNGHAIGIHTYSHDYKVIYQSPENFINEIKMTEDVLKQTLGEGFHTRLFRFPGGSFEDYKKQYKDILTESGYASVDWNVITGDGEASNLPPQKLLDRVKATLKGRQKIIVLMHDSSSKQTTVDALPGIIEYLLLQGYEFGVL